MSKFGKQIEFSAWQPLVLSNVNGVQRQPGVYRLRCVARGIPVKVKRLNGEDPSGLLYLGVSGNVRRRLLQFLKEQNLGPGAHQFHSGAFTYKEYFKGFFPLGNIQFSYCLFETRKEAEKHEHGELNKYLRAFLDSPPLNSNKGR